MTMRNKYQIYLKLSFSAIISTSHPSILQTIYVVVANELFCGPKKRIDHSDCFCLHLSFFFIQCVTLLNQKKLANFSMKHDLSSSSMLVFSSLLLSSRL
ncbi:hypothetical protein COF46_28910 [Bacillus pseudomycoides]|uniref:Uncharacterized protein n=1 Tax=Bacillus pseudomycoides TaxID=64104 RepID=A0AAJ1Z5U1_9BACI|nr:hypothetical protein [Bacillus pseudomycoides]PEO50032.1 hypothetical protein CN559_09110 [Bacillus pseudomycoides]PFZ85080.1 hypothetical protein COL70_26465 [Bacillus pseudomycoides]PHD04019.1 hypothetical protein COF46_28910 [Bacillus pseudomycoides]